jgi:epoxyqueuosine reductase
MAGLGWVGKHTLLINRALGSWFFLGGVGTSLVLDPPPAQHVDTDHCGTCTRCIDACPTGAITDHRVDATRCISYLTIEHQGPIPAEHHAAIGDWLYGCDVCQDVCPHNSDRSRDPVGVPPRSEYAAGRSSFALLDVLGWTQADRNREFRHSAMKRISLDMMKRNAIIVAGNTLRNRPNKALSDRIANLAQDESESALVRRTAAHALRAIAPNA